jgi:NAD(P)-dependent dehydrogenase (short-subunit alcohol dehydrogenase family)
MTAPAKAPVSKAVLITGCSSGIGRAAAERLASNGWNVYASARRIEDIKDLADRGCKTIALDVTDEGSMAAAARTVEEAEGAIGALVNNAGYSQSGALESVPMDLVRRQFETNVFGLVRLTQLVLPGMRRQRWGRIVNLSSMGGRLTFPGGAFYHATKHAVEALSDALRFEVRGFGINVSIVEPGLIITRFGEAAVASMDPKPADDPAYAEFNAAVAKNTVGAYEGGMSKLGAGPEAVAKVIERAITARRPKPRYVVTASARVMIGLHGVMTDRTWDRFLSSQFPRPGRG